MWLCCSVLLQGIACLAPTAQRALWVEPFPAPAAPAPVASCHGNSPQSTAQRSSEQPSPVSLGDLESYKKQAFVLKEGVEYRIKISFRVRILVWKEKEWKPRLLQSWLGECSGVVLKEWRCPAQSLLLSLQVNREIVSGLKYIQHTFRKGVKSKCFSVTWCCSV